MAKKMKILSHILVTLSQNPFLKVIVFDYINKVKQKSKQFCPEHKLTFLNANCRVPNHVTCYVAQTKSSRVMGIWEKVKIFLLFTVTKAKNSK